MVPAEADAAAVCAEVADVLLVAAGETLLDAVLAASEHSFRFSLALHVQSSTAYRYPGFLLHAISHNSFKKKSLAFKDCMSLL